MKTKVLIHLGRFRPTVPHFGVKKRENRQFGVANPHKMQKRSYPPSFSPVGWKLRFYYIWGDFGLLCSIWGQKTWLSPKLSEKMLDWLQSRGQKGVLKLSHINKQGVIWKLDSSRAMFVSLVAFIYNFWLHAYLITLFTSVYLCYLRSTRSTLDQ